MQFTTSIKRLTWLTWSKMQSSILLKMNGSVAERTENVQSEYDEKKCQYLNLENLHVQSLLWLLKFKSCTSIFIYECTMLNHCWFTLVSCLFLLSHNLHILIHCLHNHSITLLNLSAWTCLSSQIQHNYRYLCSCTSIYLHIRFNFVAYALFRLFLVTLILFIKPD